ncbi:MULTISPECIES: iron-containing redox enzyme family protein [unclassified Pseudomonas]|uniref:iron-containing redox enzyme family protein n=1 Tax=unclassified Pseudomonas TaxID=196821 RepID=UPI002AC8E53B|nr:MULTISPECIES: iron-containing redox enzyme family protein [unclassified Pseudomonas]MEB0044802.1 iron-containing redox enzyme family protein [Pseudomonas sp. Dout3]MEB0096231.1 iron-containing redox enzyme family protein [Pseudomonas sp. DC1.2]WPX59368.1 iron-containing redox enzyme family protein [Pseudomonas sp. DC1.2]
MELIQRKIQSLAESVFTHKALDNAFYQRWMGGSLCLADVEVFARNYLARTTQTSRMVALSFLSTDDLDAQIEIVKNLYSEMGYGNPEKAHLALLENYLIDLLSRLADRPYSMDELMALPVLESSQTFSREQLSLYTDGGHNNNPRHVLGTLLAQEWLAYSMLTRLYEGARNYKHLYANNDDFHEHCEYFYIHIGDAEKEHKVQAVKAATHECATDQHIEEVSVSFNRFLLITERYWNGIAHAMPSLHGLVAPRVAT